MNNINKRIVVLLFSVFACQMVVPMDQSEFLKNEQRKTYGITWCTMADAEKFAIEGRTGLIGDEEVNKKLISIVEALSPTSPIEIAQTVAMLFCANLSFTSYNTEASYICIGKMLALARTNFDIATFLLKSQSLDGSSYKFLPKPSRTSYRILEGAINMLISEHNGHITAAKEELQKLKESTNETIKSILLMFGI